MVQFSGELPEGVDPAAHGLPFAQARRIYGECVLLARLRDGVLHAFGKPGMKATLSRPFRWIETTEWASAPSEGRDGALVIKGKRLWQVHVHDPHGLPFADAILAFGDMEAADELTRLRSYEPRLGKFHLQLPEDPRIGELYDQLESALTADLAAGVLIATACPLTPIQQDLGPYSPPSNVGFAFDGDGSRQRHHEAMQLERRMRDASRPVLVPGARVTLSAAWWQPGCFLSGPQHLIADGRRFGDILVSLPAPKLSPSSPAPAEPKLLPRRGGPNPIYDWGKIHMLLGAKLHAEGNVDAGDRGRHAELVKWVQGLFQEPPGDSVTKKEVTKAIDAHRTAIGMAGN